MDRVTTAERLKEIMAERNLRQVDILNLAIPLCKKWDVKMGKSDISQYVSGKVEPSQKKLFILGSALNVSEAWLMGFDVQKERKKPAEQAEENHELICKYSLLSERDKQIIMKTIDSMLSTQESGAD